MNSVVSGTYEDEKLLDYYGGEIVTFEKSSKTEKGIKYNIVANYRFHKENKTGKFLYKLIDVRMLDIE